MKAHSYHGMLHGSLNVPIERHPTNRYMVYNGYYKVMSNIPKMGQLPTPVLNHKKLMFVDIHEIPCCLLLEMMEVQTPQPAPTPLLLMCPGSRQAVVGGSQ